MGMIASASLHLLFISVSYSFYAFNSSFFCGSKFIFLSTCFHNFLICIFFLIPHPRRYRLRHNSFTCHSSGAAVATFLFFCLRSSLSLGTLFSVLRIAFVRLLTPFFLLNALLAFFPLL